MRYVGPVVYGVLVFLGTAGTGFVLAPLLAHAAGLFPIEVEARSAFSLVTLKATPWLLGASVTSGFLWSSWAALSPARRAGVWLANVLLVWIAGALGVTWLLPALAGAGSGGDPPREDAIVFHDAKAWRVVAVRAGGSPSTLESDAGALSASPDGRFLLVFAPPCTHGEPCVAKLYDTQGATLHTLELPHASWGQGWWTGPHELRVDRQLRPHDDRAACSEGDEMFGCAARARLELAALDCLAFRFTILQRFGPNRYDELTAARGGDDEEPTSFPSPDGRQLLAWQGAAYWDSALQLVSANGGPRREIFRRKRADHGPFVDLTRLPWRPDSRAFVMESYPGTLFALLLSRPPDIVVVDVSSLAREKIGRGWNPYWLPRLPYTFQRTPSRRVEPTSLVPSGPG